MRISDWSSDVCSSDLKWPNFNVNDIVPSDRQPNQSIIRPMFWIGFEAVTAEAPGTGRECRPIGDHSGHGADPLGRAAGKSRGRGPDAGSALEPMRNTHPICKDLAAAQGDRKSKRLNSSH